MEKDFASLLSRVASNDLSVVELDIKSWTPDIPSNRAELVQRVVAALATNTHVKSLQFFDLKLTEADIAPLAELLKTRDLERLNLGGKDLTGEILLPALAAQKSLRELKLSGNRALAGLEHLRALSGLKELDLSCCDLSAVPPAVLQMPQLEVLGLSENPLKTLPASFASFSNLKQLEVRDCHFSEFPAVLLSLTQLEKLNIGWNRLPSIPDDITALVNLKVFEASRCSLPEFSIAGTQLALLEKLDLSDNSIKRVPEEIGNLQSLKVLKLSHCGLSELPGALWTLAHLEDLVLSANPLTSLPRGIGASSKLKRLNLYSCPITKLPSEMQQLKSLQVLDISGTKITHLPVWLASLRSLKELRCSYRSLVGVAVNEDTLITFGELAAVVSNSSDPEEVEKLQRSFEKMTREDPVRLVRIANMHFAPRTPLRALCVAKCVAQHSTVDPRRLPAHIRGEIVLAAQHRDQEYGIGEAEPSPAKAVKEATQKKGCLIS